ncbi:NADPH-dependent FMN reductase [Glaciimonas sp. Gout2]|uniref:NADPH-dependent FMN reductase n=1 Tax=unclassified Glaciimonas TaxID=2644401 RepID=UPI002B227441|nr:MULTISPECIES: NADPH-dependent FMN reductase [unclassified Glaciimonas]MEB0013171.1 NADPH-dependent FMN reductase [Glaciimonas sp. Cout2]MEB0081946.1 NADPH-dependent FMN reductase [Glaciimonas sp. Gout2]
MTILLLAGSPSAPSRSTRVLHHIGQKLALLGHRYTKLDVRDLPGDAVMRADFGNVAIQTALAQVAAATAVVVSTPVYKAAYSGALKAFLDLLPQFGLQDKLVLPLATGGGQSHMLALDYALRPVLSSLGPRHVLQSIYATEVQVGWSEEGGLVLAEEIVSRINEGVDQLSNSLLALHALNGNRFTSIPFSQIRCSV